MSDIITIDNGIISLSVDTFGAEIKSLKKSGKEYMWSGDERYWESTAPILFPICGALKGGVMQYCGKEYSIAMHGFAKNSQFEIGELTENALELILNSSKKSLKSYPFLFSFIVKFTLDNDKLVITNKICNKSNGDMYFSVGAHEGFSVPLGVEGARVEFENVDTMYTHSVTGPLLNGISTLLVDNTNTLELSDSLFEIDAIIIKDIKSKKISIYDSEGVKFITYIFKDFKNLLLWTKPGAPFLCVEPWSGLPDSVNSNYDFTEKADITKLSPYEEKEFEHIIIAE